MDVFDEQGGRIRLGEQVGQGGEAAIYRLAGDPARIAKIYTPRPRPDYPDKLAWMMRHPPSAASGSAAHVALAWPEDLVYDPRGDLAGYAMPYIRAAVPLLSVFNPRLRASVLPRFDRRYLHRTARNLCAAFGRLHAHGYVAGDINESNVLVTPSALVTLIDTDSFQVEELCDGRWVLHTCPVGKPEYLPPELQGTSARRARRTPAQDDFALAVLIFQLLMEGNHPFRAQWLGRGDPPALDARIASGAFPYTSSPRAPVGPPRGAPDLNRLHPHLAELFRRCFVDGHADPRLRPSAAAWEAALTEAEQALTVCPRGHVYSNHLRACPDCPAPRPAPPPQRPSPPPPARANPRTAAGTQAAQPSDPRPAQPSQRPPAASPAPTQPRANPHPSASAPTWPSPWLPPLTFRSLVRVLPRPRQLQWRWVAPRLAKSLAIGGATGALAGAVPAALFAFASQPTADAATWSLLFALGGAGAGLLRGWRPGYRFGAWLDSHLGAVFWQLIGMLAGATLGFLAGMVFWWAVFPVVLGLVFGAQLGAAGGKLLFQAGRRFGWRRISAVFGGAGAALLGWALAGWIGAGSLGQLVTGWAAGEPLGVDATWLANGAICGGIGGVVSGMAADLLARLSGLVD
jgi:serine/threonine protein kinase